MSGYRGRGSRLVYEALTRKWGRYHDRHCGCGHDWVTAHAEPAGLSVVGGGSGFVVLVGPGLTEPIGDTSIVTENVLWTALTGKPGADWAQTADVTVPAPAPPSSAALAAQKAATDAAWSKERAARNARTAAARTEPASDKQVAYLLKLVEQVGHDRFDEAFNYAVQGTTVEPRCSQERPQAALGRLTRQAARKLITSLVGP